MPNFQEIECGIKALEDTAPTVERFIGDLTEVLGPAGKILNGSGPAEEVATRLFTMPKQAPMRELLRVVLGSGDESVVGEIPKYYKLPTEARTMLDAGQIGRAANQIREGTEESLGQFHETFASLRDLGRYARPDKSGDEVLQAVRQSGVIGDNSWLGRRVTLAAKA